MREWKQKVALLEQGISPDGLPINPPRTKREILFSEVRGWFSYKRYDCYGVFVGMEWYGVGTAA